MQTFLRQVAEQILRENLGRTEQVLVVFNNHRSELFLRQRFKEISAETGSTFFLPQTMVIDDLVRQMGGLEIVQPEFLLFELYRIHCEIGGDNRKYQTFEEFIPFGDMMLNDFSEVDRYMVDAHDLFVNLHDLKAIGEWDIEDPHMSDFQRSYLEFYHSLYDYYTRLRERLALRGQAYSGMAYRLVAEKLSLTSLTPSPSPSGEGSGMQKLTTPLSARRGAGGEVVVYFVGFNAMSECERTIIGHFVHSGTGHLLTDGDSYYYNDETQEAGYFLRKHSAEFPELARRETSLFATGNKRITIVECPENVLQCKFAGQLLSSSEFGVRSSELIQPHPDNSELKTQNSALEETAIVLADESLLIPTLASLPDGQYNVNVTMGFAYADSQLHAMACKVLELHRRRNARGYYHADVAAVLGNDNYLKERGMVRVTAAEVAEMAPDAAYLFPEEMLTPDDCIALLREMTSRLLASGRLDTNPKERQAAGALAVVTDYLANLQKEYGFMRSIENLATIYNRIAQRHSISFIGQPLSGLQVLGMLETRNLDFRRVILLSANEGVLPAARSAATLIPHELKRAFNLPTYEERDSVYAYNFYRLLQRAEEVYLVYSSDAESAGKGEESRLLKQVRCELARRYPKNIEVRDWVLSSSEFGVRSSELSECGSNNSELKTPNSELKTPNSELKKASLQRLNEIATGRGFSPTALSRYLECQLKYYYMSVLGLREQDTLDDDIDASQLGETIHNVLRDIYLPFVGSRVDVQALKEARANLEVLLDKEMEHLMSGGRSSEGRNSFLRSVALTQLGRLLDREAKFIDDGHRLEIVALEQDYKYNLIAGRVDRIDRVDGHLRIIDYKTGGLKPSEIAYSTGKTMPAKWLQLMSYALMFARCKNVNEKCFVGIYPLRYLQSGVRLASWDGREEIDAAMLSDFESSLNDIISMLLDPEQPFTPTPSTENCRYCPAAAFCPALRNKF